MDDELKDLMDDVADSEKAHQEAVNDLAEAARWEIKMKVRWAESIVALDAFKKDKEAMARDIN